MKLNHLKIPVIVGIAVFAAVGAARLFMSSAATNAIAIEAEAGQLSGPAAVSGDPTASGDMITFNDPETTPTPSPTPTPGQTRSTMYVDGRHLYTAAGEKVILRGVNEMFIWMQSNTWGPTLSEIAKSNANVVRLVWDTSGSAANLDTLTGLTIQNKMIPMGELHDATGGLGAFPSIVDYWTRSDVVALVKKYEKWFVLNIANENGPSVSDEVFLSTYKPAITRIRATGINVPLVIDGTQWAMNYEQIWRTWQELRDHDPQKNVMFSLHSYWGGSNVTATYDAVTAKVASDNIPLLIGEGPTAIGSSCGSVPYQHLMQKLHENEIGWISWSWGKANNQGCGPNSQFDMTRDGIYGNWEYDHARILVEGSPYSIKSTSVRPAEFR